MFKFLLPLRLTCSAPAKPSKCSSCRVPCFSDGHCSPSRRLPWHSPFLASGANLSQLVFPPDPSNVLHFMLPSETEATYPGCHVVHSLSRVQLFAIPWTAAYQASLSFIISQSLLRFMSTELVMLSNHFILCCSLLFLPSIVSSIRVFSNELSLHIMWPQYWSFSFSTVLPVNIQGLFPLGLTGLISFQSNCKRTLFI